MNKTYSNNDTTQLSPHFNVKEFVANAATHRSAADPRRGAVLVFLCS